MRNRKRYRWFLIWLFTINIFGTVFFIYYRIDRGIPDEIKLLVDTKESFDFGMPLEGKISAGDTDAISVNNLKVPSDRIHIDLNQPFTLESSQTGQYNIDLKLFGLIAFKKISLDVIEKVELIPCGFPIGIYVETNGILVLGSGRITGEDGLNYEPVRNRLKSGDYILEINGQAVTRKSELIAIIQECRGKDITLLIRRNREKITVEITPVKTASGNYKIGAWIRDNTQGIGTLTFISTDGQFGALGHGITDVDTGLLLDVKAGSIYSAEIMSIIKGKEGEPGELIGMIRQNEKYKVGSINKNTYQGIFGHVSYEYDEGLSMESLKIGLKQEVKTGKAYVRCTIEDEVTDYEIEIVSVDISNNNHNKGIVIKITDPRLLELTGGIVQGMSGSPILQNNKIIGAVTHVFIQDSTKGYGTFIENMVNNLE
jgi:stage IV sporulation protein B